VAEVLAGADSIDDLDLVRHGGMRMLFGGVYARSTLGAPSSTLTLSCVPRQYGRAGTFEFGTD
jgi:hypothetical protein